MTRYETVKSFVTDEVFTVPRWLTQDKVKNCKVFCDREEMTEHLLKGGIVAEVGTDKGHFAKMICNVVKPRELHVFDLTFERMERIESSAVILHEGDSSTEMAKLRGNKPGWFDWIYIDGDHSYEGVVKDIEQAVRLIKPDGLLIFNDYTIYSPLENSQIGVKRAVNDLLLDEGFEMVLYALHSLGYCDVAVRRQLG
jgi:predicted O-methyltransferase YrrM